MRGIDRTADAATFIGLGLAFLGLAFLVPDGAITTVLLLASAGAFFAAR